MSADRTPQGEFSLLAHAIAPSPGPSCVFRSPPSRLGVALACVSIYLSTTRLSFHTSRLDLLNPESDYNRLWIEYINEFGDDDDAVVVVEGASRDQVVPVLQEISQALSRQERLFHAVLHEVDLGKIRSKGLHYLSPDELMRLDGFLAEVGPIVSGNWSLLNLGHMTEGLWRALEGAARVPNRSRPPSAIDAETERFGASLVSAAVAGGEYQSPWPAMPQSFATLSELSGEYLLTKEGQLGFVVLRLAKGRTNSPAATEATDALRDLIAQMSTRHPETKIGLTGLPIMENDEMRSSQTSMFWASLLSMFGVGALFVAGFGGIRHALLANLVLLLGMAWAFGYVTLAVGHLNILSVSFTATLIGIGIDYGVYYSARYLQLRDEALFCDDALVRRRSRSGPVDPHRRHHHGRGFLRRRLYEFHRHRRVGHHRRRRHHSVRDRRAGRPAGRDLPGRSQRLWQADARGLPIHSTDQSADEDAAAAVVRDRGRHGRISLRHDAAVVRP